MRILSLTVSTILGALMGFLLFYFINTFGTSVVEIPNLKGLECDVARKRLMSLGFDVISNDGSEVINTYPPPGMRVRKTRSVKLFCSKTEEGFDLEILRGASLKFASEIARTFGLKIEISRMRYKGNLNEVVALKVDDGKVFLLVDSGIPEKYGVVPNLVGLDVKSAEEISKNSGLEIIFRGKGSYVVDQVPEPGSVATEIIAYTE